MTEVNYNDGYWHRWGGDPMSVSHLHSETIVAYQTFEGFGLPRKVKDTPWMDVVAFYVKEEYGEPRHFWINKYTSAVTRHEPDIFEMEDYIHVREVK